MNEKPFSGVSDGRRTFIVTTALEETWPKGQPIVFLGDWCLRYSRRDEWSALEYLVSPYHWDDRSRIPQDLAYLNGIYEKLLPELSSTLNQIHGVEHSVRYWRIVAGWWLFYFAQILFDRWRVITSTAEAFPNAVLIRAPDDLEVSASMDMAGFLDAIQSDAWNERLWADLAEGCTGLTVLHLDDAKAGSNRNRGEFISYSLRQPSLRRIVYLKISGVLDWLNHTRFFSRQRVVLHSDYLKRVVKLKLELLLGQIPILSAPRPLPESPANIEMRQWKLGRPQGDFFADLLAAMVPRYLPTCYLEGYESSVRISGNSGWPQKPLVMMTANAFSRDERWKFWAGSQCESGAKLVVAQHGGNYGVGAWSATQINEIAISDRYLSWGWEDKSAPKVRRAPATKLIGMRKRKPAESGSCLQITGVVPRYSDFLVSFPIGPQFHHYLDDQFCFAHALAKDVRRELVVRLHYLDFDWELQNRWKDSEPSITIDEGHSDLRLLLRKARLVVATYNATTFIETFVQGIPTVLFWNPHYWELSKTAQSHFDRLRRASVFFEDPTSCANHVNEIWNDVPAWWASEQVQEAVQGFCDEYAYLGRSPLRELKIALTKW